MKMKFIKKISSLFLCMMLIMAMALCTTGCSDDKKENPEPPVGQEQSTDTTVLGEGATTFNFIVVDKDGKETPFEIHTDKTIVGEALQELNLLEGEEGEFGLFVKKVNGIEADYNKDGVYWAFYVNNEYAIKGVDETNITPEDIYMFKVEK